MSKLYLPNVTLACIDGLNRKESWNAFTHCLELVTFGDELFIRDSNIDSVEAYSNFVFKKLHERIYTGFCMIIQADGYILNPNKWTDEFLDYDYIGAPWWYNDGLNVGNGGFSIRSRDLMQELSKKHYTLTHPEDHHICRTYGKALKSMGFTFAPEDLAAKFSIEINQNRPFFEPGTFGFHGYKKLILK